MSKQTRKINIYKTLYSQYYDINNHKNDLCAYFKNKVKDKKIKTLLDMKSHSDFIAMYKEKHIFIVVITSFRILNKLIKTIAKKSVYSKKDKIFYKDINEYYILIENEKYFNIINDFLFENEISFYLTLNSLRMIHYKESLDIKLKYMTI